MYLYELLWYFVIYAFLGWCAEVIYAAVRTGDFVNRGFLNGPVCPIYGAGVAIVVLVLSPLRRNLAILFLGSVLLTSALEFCTGYVLDRIYHEKWWDYSKDRFNVKGYICLKFSLLWGLACVLVLDGVHPLIAYLVNLIPHLAGMILLSLFLALLLTDWIITSSALARFHRDFSILEKTAEHLKGFSNGMGENLAEGVLDAKRRNDALKAGVEKKLNEKQALLERYISILRNPGFTRKRILKAFPHLEKNGRHTRLKDLMENRRK